MDCPRSPVWNMGLDEALFEGAGAALPLTLRRMAWAEPAATLGRFQSYTEFVVAGALRPSIRRITGGGAILHAGECTLSMAAAAPSPAFPETGARALALRVSESLRAALRAVASGGGGQGAVDVRGGNARERAVAAHADCFDRRSPFDLVVRAGSTEEKAAGFALHRGRGRVLVQASIRRDRAALAAGDDGNLLDAWARSLGAAAPFRADPTLAETKAAALHVERRYGRDDWNRRGE
ncbi:MAG: hypothetical protein L0Z55_08335 [Planctomycetes bacterium]|nr:hypothetical protein [Planctomycetota bacterium]